MAPERIERPIILLDLNATLSSNYIQVRDAARETSFADAVTAVEQYRQWLVDWLKQSGFEVFLFTARPAQLERVTLDSIQSKTGWQPDEAHFNDTEFRKPPDIKRAKLEALYVRGLQAEQLFALESNSQTRDMYAENGVRSRRIAVEADLPTFEQVLSGEPVEPVLKHGSGA